MKGQKDEGEGRMVAAPMSLDVSWRLAERNVEFEANFDVRSDGGIVCAMAVCDACSRMFNRVQIRSIDANVQNKATARRVENPNDEAQMTNRLAAFVISESGLVISESGLVISESGLVISESGLVKRHLFCLLLRVLPSHLFALGGA